MTLKIGITGQNGFVGTHLFNTMGLFPDEFERLEFNKVWFSNKALLDSL
jgi:UDP-2-acetamido-2,6-beta-L-arabino-hexul-4-ose reductase